jgi:hypothetical protein
MANKSEFVDIISEATQQKRRRVMLRVTEPAAKEERRLSHWPPGRFAQWRLENLTPWKLSLKSWKFTDWE